MRLSQNSICEKNNRCWQPASARSFAVKNGVSRANHFWPQLNSSWESSESASSWRRSGAEHRYSGRSGDFVLVVRCLSCGSFEPDSLDECIKVIDDSVVDAVELSSPLVSDSGVGADGVKKTRGERGVDALE